VARKQLTTRSLEKDTLLISMQREVIPYIRQTGDLVDKLAPIEPPVITGSRSAATAAVLTLLLTALAKAGAIKDSTTP
jgi:hypothetical protein